MFKNGWEKFLKKVSNDDDPSRRRRYVRRDQDVCVLEINGQTYPVKDWSMGGALIETYDKTTNIGDTVDFTIKFKLKDRVLEVPHSAQIVRKNKNYTALRFEALPGETRAVFDDIVKDAIA
tara:strand:+ start:227 stop:589 length:363 start_codon:yes stop_codon:yes gene_type:complete